MAQSEQINELAKALAEAQPHIGHPMLDKRGNFGPYASLASLRKAVLPALNAKGIAVSQLVVSDDSSDFVETKLMHISGQWLSSRMKLKLDKPSMQGYGSAITYACRYSLQALAGGGGEDDDDGSAAEQFPARPEMKNAHPRLSADEATQPFGQAPSSTPQSSGVSSHMYVIDLGNLKDGKPHWLNGKTFEEIDRQNSNSKANPLQDTYDFLNGREYRNAKITRFLQEYEKYRPKDKDIPL